MFFLTNLLQTQTKYVKMQSGGLNFTKTKYRGFFYEDVHK